MKESFPKANMGVETRQWPLIMWKTHGNRLNIRPKLKDSSQKKVSEMLKSIFGAFMNLQRTNIQMHRSILLGSWKVELFFFLHRILGKQMRVRMWVCERVEYWVSTQALKATVVPLLMAAVGLWCCNQLYLLIKFSHVFARISVFDVCSV